MKIAILTFAATLAACSSPPPAPVFDAPLGAEFVARLSHPVRLDGISIEFTRVLEESRCPKHVTCVWAGAAKVALTALVGAAPQELTLSTAPAAAASTRHAGYRIELLDLAPYPDATVRLAAMNYAVKLRITRVE